MSHGVKLTLFLLAFNIIGFAEGYLLHELGLPWLVPIILVNGVWSGAAESAVVAARKSLITTVLRCLLMVIGAS